MMSAARARAVPQACRPAGLYCERRSAATRPAAARGPRLRLRRPPLVPLQRVRRAQRAAGHRRRSVDSVADRLRVARRTAWRVTGRGASCRASVLRGHLSGPGHARGPRLPTRLCASVGASACALASPDRRFDKSSELHGAVSSCAGRPVADRAPRARAAAEGAAERGSPPRTTFVATRRQRDRRPRCGASDTARREGAPCIDATRQLCINSSYFFVACAGRMERCASAALD
ncbi:hypothetical protein PsYK624_009440 [Phanerochaete sordida]|uniref:Uncharacterized protein n=1 Tax=Phanerochaete sordida TaxID=48140 RepID=A0A9P3L8D0_9APHY|nr:hypothetical protein PsYK624_009440 [Phanerochaete sordida]